MILTIEEVLASFFDDTALRVPGYKLKRLNYKGSRYYYTFNEETQDPRFYISVTSVTSASMPTSPGLIKWIASLGVEGAERQKMRRADFGTFLHNQIEKFLIDGYLDLGDDLYTNFLNYAHEKGYDHKYVNEHIDELKKDLVSFAMFAKEREVKPIAIEIPLKSDKWGIAGTADLVCEMTFNKKRITAIVDFKSGKKGFFDSHEAQLHMLKGIWLENFDRPIDCLFNWAGTDWRKEPKYKLQNQTKSIQSLNIDHYIQITKNNKGEINNQYLAPSITGKIKMGEFNPEMVGQFTVSEYVKLLNR